ncbi:MAG: 6-bladed beta-propeller [Desulfuromonadaceae bacterium]|nr:6-bladed beta-propeller [Desulfuromonadaceae bacterium]MDD2855986.1 6-bladed beta-propeller [Desulfuromonadaceae bacterium]
MKKTFSKILLLLFVTSIISACAMGPKVVEKQKRFFWPPEPDVPRIEWIASYFGDTDVKEKTFVSEIVGTDVNVRLKRPVDVAGDGEGRFVVSDQVNMQAFFFDLNKRTVTLLGNEGGGDSGIRKPSGVSVDADGNFYVADTVTSKVYVVNSKNSVLRVFDFSDRMKSIAGICVDRTRKRLLMTDFKEKNVLIYTLDGEYVSTVNGNGYYTSPISVAVESDGTIVIADAYNVTVVRFSADGSKFISSFGQRGDTPGSFALIVGLAVDSEDHIYVTDAKLHNVSIFDKDGNSLMTIGGKHSVLSGNFGVGGFLIPQGIFIDKNDRIYVADSQNSRVQIFQYLNNRYLAEHPIEAPVR